MRVKKEGGRWRDERGGKVRRRLEGRGGITIVRRIGGG